jgi:peptidoglycan hydrolase CwlO-like protein
MSVNTRSDNQRWTRAAVAVLLVVLVTAAAAAIGGACCPSPAAASPHSLAALQKEARQVRSQMQRLEVEMQVVTQKWEAARQRLDVVSQQLIGARRQLDRSRAALDEQRGLVSSRMVTMYKTGEFTWLDIVANSSSLADAETVLDFQRRISELDRSEETKLQRLASEARRLERAVENERRQAAAAQQDIDAQRAAMDQKIAERAILLKDVVAQIKKILSAPELLMKAGGKVTQITWAQAFLKRLAMPMTADNVAAIVAWEMAEGGHWYNTAYYNPLNTTQSMPGATVFNSVGVKAYKSWMQGLEASVITIHNGYYGGILAALRVGNDGQAVAAAVAASPWGTGLFDVKS